MSLNVIFVYLNNRNRIAKLLITCQQLAFIILDLNCDVSYLNFTKYYNNLARSL